MAEIKDAWPMNREDQRTLIVGVHGRLRRQYKGAPFWVFIRDITNHGAGYSSAICEANGWNPDQDGSIPIF